MILITGGAGYIGSHVLSELSKAGEPVVVVDNLSTGHRESLLQHETLVQCDLGNHDQLTAVFDRYKPDTVMHFAASINAPESVRIPIAYYQNNLVNTISLLSQVQTFGIKQFIFSSTAAVYGSVGDTPVTEEMATTPLNPYGWSKLMSEQVIKDTCQVTGTRYVCLRYFNVAGADPESRIGQRTQGVKHLLRSCMDAAMGRTDAITVYGQDYPTPDGTGVRDYIHVCDLATAHIAALEYLRTGAPSQIFNVGYGTGYSVLEVIEMVRRVTGKDLAISLLPRRPGDAAAVIANSEKIRAMTTWTPTHNSLEKIVTDAWNWEQKMQQSHS